MFTLTTWGRCRIPNVCLSTSVLLHTIPNAYINGGRNKVCVDTCVVGCHSGLSGKAWPGWVRISGGKDIMLPDLASDLMLILLTVRPQSISSTSAPITLCTCTALALFDWCSSFWNILTLYKIRAVCNVVLWEFFSALQWSD